MRGQPAWITRLMVAGALCAAAPSMARAVPFTWDPASASPSLAGAGSAFTADTMVLDFHLYSAVQADGTFAAHRINRIIGFSLNGSPVTPAGFGTSYGLYFDSFDAGSSALPTSPVFSSSNVTLKADPGNKNGAASSSLSGVGFANQGPTGAADDITLATGSLVSYSTNIDPMAGALNSYFLNTFTASLGEAGFFASPALDGSAAIEFLGSVSLGAFTLTTQPNGTNIQTTDTTGISARLVAAPEPGSMGLLAAGLFGLTAFLWRRRA